MRKEQIITTNNNQMEEKGMKSRFIHFKKRFVPALSGALMGVLRSFRELILQMDLWVDVQISLIPH